jgi:hypothetical protein
MSVEVLVAVVRCCDDYRNGPAIHKQVKAAFSVLDRIYSHLLRELPGGAVRVETADKSDFLVDGTVTRPVDASDPESRRHRLEIVSQIWLL